MDVQSGESKEEVMGFVLVRLTQSPVGRST